jgi:hypothetical protein
MATPTTLSAAAERNKDPILAVLREVLPASGTVLEVASGTGQHARHFAASLPGLAWQPTEATAGGCASLSAYLAASMLPNLRAACVLDVRDRPWQVAGPFAAVLSINLIHIAPPEVTGALLHGAREQLRSGSPLVLYGPYREGGRHTAPSNEAFDASLRARNPTWGVRDLGEVTAAAEEAGFARTRIERLPANNLCVVFVATG